MLLDSTMLDIELPVQEDAYSLIDLEPTAAPISAASHGLVLSGTFIPHHLLAQIVTFLCSPVPLLSRVVYKGITRCDEDSHRACFLGFWKTGRFVLTQAQFHSFNADKMTERLQCRFYISRGLKPKDNDFVDRKFRDSFYYRSEVIDALFCELSVLSSSNSSAASDRKRREIFSKIWKYYANPNVLKTALDPHDNGLYSSQYQWIRVLNFKKFCKNMDSSNSKWLIFKKLLPHIPQRIRGFPVFMRDLPSMGALLMTHASMRSALETSGCLHSTEWNALKKFATETTKANESFIFEDNVAENVAENVHRQNRSDCLPYNTHERARLQTAVSWVSGLIACIVTILGGGLVCILSWILYGQSLTCVAITPLSSTMMIGAILSVGVGLICLCWFPLAVCRRAMLDPMGTDSDDDDGEIPFFTFEGSEEGERWLQAARHCTVFFLIANGVVMLFFSIAVFGPVLEAMEEFANGTTANITMNVEQCGNVELFLTMIVVSTGLAVCCGCCSLLRTCK